MTTTSLTITGPMRPRYDEILTPDALAFVEQLQHRFAGQRHTLLADRMQLRYDLGNGRDLRFLPETEHIRNDDSWRVAGFGPGLEDRRVEITGPCDPKMTINALNSRANVWLADLEDATSRRGATSSRASSRSSMQFASNSPTPRRKAASIASRPSAPRPSSCDRAAGTS